MKYRRVQSKQGKGLENENRALGCALLEKQCATCWQLQGLLSIILVNTKDMDPRSGFYSCRESHDIITTYIPLSIACLALISLDLTVANMLPYYHALQCASLRMLEEFRS